MSGLVRLDNVVQIVAGQTASRIDRVDRQRQVSLRASIAPGYALADRLDALRQAVHGNELAAPPTPRASRAGAGSWNGHSASFCGRFCSR